MDLPWLIAIIATAGYLAGSLPFGYLTATFAAGIDIRREGSGNIGATNIGRVLGAKWGLFVLGLDCLKGLLPVLIVRVLRLGSEMDAARHLEVVCGLTTICGHMFPIWLKFRGGKGVATALGVAIALGPWATLAAFLVFVTAFAVFRIVSLASMSAAVTFGAVQIVQLLPEPFSRSQWSYAVFSMLVPALIIYRHRANLIRLLRGEEARFQFGAKNRTRHESSEDRDDDTGRLE